MEPKPYMLTDREADMLREYVLKTFREVNEQVAATNAMAKLVLAQSLHDLSERLRG